MAGSQHGQIATPVALPQLSGLNIMLVLGAVCHAVGRGDQGQAWFHQWSLSGNTS